MTFIVCFTIISFPFVIAVLGTLVVCVTLYLKSPMKNTSSYPKLYFKESALASHLLKRYRLMNRKFDPPWWLRNAHVQTILPYLSPSPETEYDREYLQMRDKGVVALDWVVHDFVSIHKRKRCTVLLVLPGVTADALSVSTLCNLAARKGFRPVVFNQRGCGHSVLMTPKLLSQGDPTDLRQVVKYIHGRYPKAFITIIGYGTGSSLLLSYLGEYGSSANVCVGACISACFDQLDRFSKSAHGFYELLYLTTLKVNLSVHAGALSKQINFSALMGTWSFKRFDEIMYSKMYNFLDAEEFFEKNNSLRDVDEISVPLLFVNSLDDPFCSSSKIPYELCMYYPHFFMIVTHNGGHCGFKDTLKEPSWCELLCLDYLDSVLEFTNRGNTINYGKNQVRSTI